MKLHNLHESTLWLCALWRDEAAANSVGNNRIDVIELPAQAQSTKYIIRKPACVSAQFRQLFVRADLNLL